VTETSSISKTDGNQGANCTAGNFAAWTWTVVVTAETIVIGGNLGLRSDRLKNAQQMPLKSRTMIEILLCQFCF
jgi:hypothetical protein